MPGMAGNFQMPLHQRVVTAEEKVPAHHAMGHGLAEKQIVKGPDKALKQGAPFWRYGIHLMNRFWNKGQ